MRTLKFSKSIPQDDCVVVMILWYVHHLRVYEKAKIQVVMGKLWTIWLDFSAWYEHLKAARNSYKSWFRQESADRRTSTIRIGTGSCRFCLSKIVEGYSTIWWRSCMPQLLDPAYGLRCEQYITADRTNLCRYVINHDNPISLAHSMHNFALLILTWASIWHFI